MFCQVLQVIGMVIGDLGPPASIFIYLGGGGEGSEIIPIVKFFIQAISLRGMTMPIGTQDNTARILQAG